MNVLDRITSLREERNWTEYQLAMRAELPQSTISSWYKKHLLPSLSSLEKICDAFGLTLCQFFSEEENIIATDREKALLHEWRRLESEQQDAFLCLLKTL